MLTISQTPFNGLAAVLFAAAWCLLMRQAKSGTKDSLAGLSWRNLVGVGIIAQAIGMVGMFGVGAAAHFGFAQALSASAFLATVLLWFDRAVTGLLSLWKYLLPVVVAALLLALVFPGGAVDASRPWFAVHLVLAVFSYGLISLAVGLAFLMMRAERDLRQPLSNTQTNTNLPPLLVLERLMFRVIFTGFIALTLTLGSGILFSEQMFGRAMRFDHKTVFSMAAWVVFVVLLLGRALRGWRGRVAMRFTLGGFGLLVLGYIGTRFVLEVILQRASA